MFCRRAENIIARCFFAVPLCLLCLTVFAACPGPARADGTPRLKLLSLRIAEAGFAEGGGQSGRFSLIAVFNEKPEYDLLALGNPPRLALSLPPALFAFSAAQAQKSGRISALRYGADGAGRSRLVITLKEPFRLEALYAEPLDSANPRAPWQLTAELSAVSGEEFRRYLQLRRAGGAFLFSGAAQNAAETGAGAKRLDARRAFRVMIDPGHGGFDSGAVSADGAREKQVTLAFAKILCKALQKQPGIEPHLTRSDDTFLRLGARVEKARAARAGLFISIHADHIADPHLRGATVYTLSDKATDDMSKLLAEYQNKADLSDGLPAAAPPAVADILLDMTRRETRLFSEDFARLLLRAMRGGGIELIHNPRRAAGFQVLRAADIPSALIELGYLSSPEDAKRITSPQWQEKMAGIIAGSVAAYARARQKPAAALKKQ